MSERESQEGLWDEQPQEDAALEAEPVAEAGLGEPDAQDAWDYVTPDDEPEPWYEDDELSPWEGDDAADERPVGSSLAKAGSGAAAAAASASQQLKEGLDAVRSVRELSRRHADARAQLQELRSELEDAMQILDHRAQIEGDYERILAEQTTAIEQAHAAEAEATARIDALSSEREQLNARLAAMRAEHEESLRPYKNLMDTTKGRADDAAVSLADARRSVKSAESQANEATRRRDQRISAANRAVDNAQDRLRRVQTELDKLSGDSDAPITALPKMRDELVAERAHLDAARSDVEKVTAEAQQAVEEAQARLFSLRQTLEDAERAAEEAKREATARREEYDRLYKEARAQEDELEGAVKQRTKDMEAEAKKRESIRDDLDELQIVLDEANDIHATPEVTAQLRERIAAGQEELERQDAEVQDLAQSERELRSATRGKRIAFFAVIALAVLVAILLIWFFATR